MALGYKGMKNCCALGDTHDERIPNHFFVDGRFFAATRRVAFTRDRRVTGVHERG
jgi:hypothetical protein